MHFQTRPRPADPYVSKNLFRGRTYPAKEILSFTEARTSLPSPVLPEFPLWEEMYWRAWEIAWSNLWQPRSASGFPANLMTDISGDRILMWDSAFLVQFGVYGRRAFDFISILDNFYSKQHRDGFICREISTKNGNDLYYPFDPDSTGPNVLSWAEWRYFRLTGDERRQPEVFWPLLAYHRWLKANRTWPNGLYWTTGSSSSLLGQERVPGGDHHHCHWTWVDANMQAALDTQNLAKMAIAIDERKLAETLVDEHAHLVREINAKLWNEGAAFYQDVAPDGSFSRKMSIGAYWALLDKHIVTEQRLEPFISHLRSKGIFKRPHEVPGQVAYGEGDSNAPSQGWVLPTTNFMLIKGLRALGQNSLAHKIASNHLEIVSSVYQRTGTFWEYYASESAEPGPEAKPEFVGWTGLSPIAILLEDIIGLQIDWPHRRLVWDRRLVTDSPYGVRNLPVGQDGLVSLVGDAGMVTVEASVPFTLVVQTPEKSLQVAVLEGRKEFTL